ncbi:PAN/Apple domain-containing protein, partial [Actibacterium sp.]|uniref:PAN/Apple domain-containing protein n=1 Tax=Actibacterium sp. TaxID=1872125 RepID=UPI003565CAB7
MRRFLVASVLSVAALVSPVLAQQDIPVPDRRVTLSVDTDFPGGDLRALFDTSYTACERACLSDAACGAFTFNSRANSCFPKSGVQGQETYQGAISGVVLATDPGVLAKAATRRAELGFVPDDQINAARQMAQGLGGRFRPDGRSAAELLETARAA